MLKVITISGWEKSFSSTVKIGSALAAAYLKNNVSAVIADKTVLEFYPDLFSGDVLPADAGEKAKSFDAAGRLIHWMAGKEIHRDGILTVVGGGSVGDVAGFAASVYMRGIPWILVPTTLLSMIDSSIGGKTAVNIEGIKNAAGSFHQPSEIIIDPVFIKTLTDDEYMSGLGEVVKTALSLDEKLYALLTKEHELVKKRDTDLLVEIIETAVRAKAEIIQKDPFEQDLRTVLNLGHTAAHMIESDSGFKVPHGKAVATGIFIESSFGMAEGLVSGDVHKDICGILEVYGFDKNYIPTDRNKMSKAFMLDKKQRRGKLRMPFLSAVGKAVVADVPVEKAEKLSLYFSP